MKNKTYTLNTVLTAVLTAVLAVMVALRTFAPQIILPILSLALPTPGSHRGVVILPPTAKDAKYTLGNCGKSKLPRSVKSPK